MPNNMRRKYNYGGTSPVKGISKFKRFGGGLPKAKGGGSCGSKNRMKKLLKRK